ncbi:MAG: AEC family transporter [Myxococcota bacterium]
MSLLAKLAPLLVAIALGVLAGAVRLFPRPGTAVEMLNRYVLYVAFPLLIVGSVGSARYEVPAEPAFYLSHVLAFALVVGAIRLSGAVLPSLRANLGALSLGGLFGNIAYVGLPFTTRVLGEEALGLAAMAVSVHVVLSMTLGPLLLLRWNAETRDLEAGTLLRMVARQPLVWSPFVGLLVRALPEDVVAPVLAPLAPVGGSAAPVALFMLGLYLHLNRRELRRPDAETAFLVVAKLAMFPALALAATWPLYRHGLLAPLELQVIVLLCAMPTAITTFSISQDYDVGQRVVARGIVASTVLCLATLPVVAALLGAVG